MFPVCRSWFFAINTWLYCETASTQVCKDFFLYDYTTFANIQKKKASNFWLHTCKCPATQSITWDIHQDTLKTRSCREKSDWINYWAPVPINTVRHWLHVMKSFIIVFCIGRTFKHFFFSRLVFVLSLLLFLFLNRSALVFSTTVRKCARERCWFTECQTSRDLWTLQTASGSKTHSPYVTHLLR